MVDTRISILWRDFGFFSSSLEEFRGWTSLGLSRRFADIPRIRGYDVAHILSISATDYATVLFELYNSNKVPLLIVVELFELPYVFLICLGIASPAQTVEIEQSGRGWNKE